MAVCRIRRIFFLAWVYRYVRGIRIRACSFGGCFIDYAACKDVFFGYGIAGGKCFLCARCQFVDLPCLVAGVSGQFIRYFDVFDRQVSVILHGDLIGDRFAKRIALAVCRAAGRGLFHGQVRIRISRDHFIRSRVFFSITENSSCCISEFTSEDILFCDRVSCCGFYKLTRLYICKLVFTGNGNSRLLCDGDVLSLCVDVLYGDLEGNRIIKVVFFTFMSLCYNTGDILICDSQCSIFLSDHVVGCFGLRNCRFCL